MSPPEPPASAQGSRLEPRPAEPTSTRPGPARAGAGSPATALPASARPPRAALIWLALAVVYVLWGSTYLGIRVVTESMPPFGSASVRFAAAGLLLGLVLATRRGIRALRVSRAQLGASALVGVLLLAGGNGMVVLAESPRFALPSGIAALLIALVPVLLVVFRWAAGDRARPTTVIGVAVGLAGLALLFLPSVGGRGAHTAVPVAGGLLVLLGVLSWSIGSFWTRRLPMPQDPFVASVYQMLAGALVLAGVALALGEGAPLGTGQAPARAWLALGYLIVFGSLVAYTAYVWLLHHAPISLVSTYAYVNPVIALALGALLVAESLPAPVLLAAAIVLVGVALVVSTERPPATPRADPDASGRP